MKLAGIYRQMSITFGIYRICPKLSISGKLPDLYNTGWVQNAFQASAVHSPITTNIVIQPRQNFSENFFEIIGPDASALTIVRPSSNFLLELF